uniref:Uncharacterized protein n=1 Tax=Glossina palpalis gambiensis TaxID=67801 RepID=A0A1B0BVI7_9MUSC
MYGNKNDKHKAESTATPRQQKLFIKSKRKDDLNKAKMTEMLSDTICGAKQNICNHNCNTGCPACRSVSFEGETLADEEGFSELEEDGKEEVDRNGREGDQQQIQCELHQSHINEQLKTTPTLSLDATGTVCKLQRTSLVRPKQECSYDNSVATINKDEEDTRLQPISNKSNENECDEIEGCADENDDDEESCNNIKQMNLFMNHEKYEKYRDKFGILYNDENINDDCNNKKSQLFGHQPRYSKKSHSVGVSDKDETETYDIIHQTKNRNATKPTDAVPGNIISSKPTLMQISPAQFQFPPFSRYIQHQRNLPPDFTQTYTSGNSPEQRQNAHQEHERLNTTNRLGIETSPYINTNFSSLLDVLGGSYCGQASQKISAGNGNGNSNFSAGLNEDKFSIIHNAPVNSHEFLTKKYYHPLFAHGVCRWPGCELGLQDINAFVK